MIIAKLTHLWFLVNTQPLALTHVIVAEPTLELGSRVRQERPNRFLICQLGKCTCVRQDEAATIN